MNKSWRFSSNATLIRVKIGIYVDKTLHCSTGKCILSHIALSLSYVRLYGVHVQVRLDPRSVQGRGQGRGREAGHRRSCDHHLQRAVRDPTEY